MKHFTLTINLQIRQSENGTQLVERKIYKLVLIGK